MTHRKQRLDGLTLRDLFAGLAMPEVLGGTIPRNVPEKEVPLIAARLAYAIADAMLTVRSEKT